MWINKFYRIGNCRTLCSGLCSSEGPSLAHPWPDPYLRNESFIGPPGTCAPYRSHSELLAPSNLMPHWDHFQSLHGSLTWSTFPGSVLVCASQSWGDKGQFVEDEERNWMWGLECSYVWVRPLEMLIWARGGRRKGVTCDGAGLPGPLSSWVEFRQVQEFWNQTWPSRLLWRNIHQEKRSNIVHLKFVLYLWHI